MPKLGTNTRIKLVGGELTFNIDGKNVDAWLARQDNFKTQARNLAPVFQSFGRYMLGSIDRNFTSEGRPKQWRRLSPQYARYKQRKVGSKPILVWSGRMRRGFKFTATQRTLQIYNNRTANGVKLFPLHQDGYAPNNLPARPMLILQDRDKAEMTRLFRRHLFDN